MNAFVKQKAFTIVELLIVIVVIGILAAITTAVFNGANERARQSLVKDALAKVSRQLELDKVNRGTYALQLVDANADTINDVNYQYSSNGTGYCVTATKGPTTMHVCNGQQIANGPYLGGTGPDAQAGHSDPNAPPPVIEIAGSSSLHEINEPAQSTPVLQSASIPGTLSPSDTVLVLYNVDFYSHIHGANAGGVQFQQVYRKTMGASGYQQTVAYMGTGMSGEQTLQSLACYGGNSTTACNTGTNVKAQYKIFVIKGKSSPLTMQTTDTTYGGQTTGSVVAPANISVSQGDVVFFAYVYYGNNMPSLADASSPGLDWTTGSARTGALSRPGSNNGTALGVSYAVAQATGSAGRSVVTPASGTVYAGATLFVFK